MFDYPHLWFLCPFPNVACRHLRFWVRAQGMNWFCLLTGEGVDVPATAPSCILNALFNNTHQHHIVGGVINLKFGVGAWRKNGLSVLGSEWASGLWGCLKEMSFQVLRGRWDFRISAPCFINRSLWGFEFWKVVKWGCESSYRGVCLVTSGVWLTTRWGVWFWYSSEAALVCCTGLLFLCRRPTTFLKKVLSVIPSV